MLEFWVVSPDFLTAYLRQGHGSILDGSILMLLVFEKCLPVRSNSVTGMSLPQAVGPFFVVTFVFSKLSFTGTRTCVSVWTALPALTTTPYWLVKTGEHHTTFVANDGSPFQPFLLSTACINPFGLSMTFEGSFEGDASE